MNDTIEMIEPIEVPTPTSQALTIVNTQVAKFCELEAGFVALEARYKDVVYAVGTTAGLDEAKKARAEIRAVRFAAQNLLKETTKPLNQLKADVIEFADRIVARITLTEDPIDAQIKAEESRKAVEKAAKEQAERELAAKVEASFAQLAINTDLVGAPIEALELAIEVLDAIEISIEVFGARAGEALQLKMKTLDRYDVMVEAAKAQAEVAKANAAAMAEIAAARQKLADEQAAAAKELAAARAQLEKDQRIARMAEEAKAAAAQKVEDDRIAEERRVAKVAADAAQKALDDLAAAERKRLDDIAAAERAEQKRVDDLARAEQERMTASANRVRAAAADMLETLQMIEVSIHNGSVSAPIEVAQAIRTVIERATKEQA